MALDDSKIEDTILYTLDNLIKIHMNMSFYLNQLPLLEKKKPLLIVLKFKKKNNINSVFTVCRSNKYYGKVKNNNFSLVLNTAKKKTGSGKSIFLNVALFIVSK